jgi:dTDP-4-dehydrorhamnose reductase
VRILLTGAAGQLGRELGPRLAQFGQVVGVDRSLVPEKSALRLDLGEAADVEALLARLRPALIVNAAAHTAVDRAEDEREAAFRLNGDLPGWLGHWAAQNDASMVHFSTDYVFRGDSCRPYTEDDTPDPLNVYGASKLAGEEAVAASGCRHVVLRTSWVYSSNGHNFVLTMLKLAAERERLDIVDDQTGRPTWASNLAAVSARVVERWRQQPAGDVLEGLYHYCDATAVSWYGFAETILRIARSSGLLTGVPELRPVDSGQFAQAARRPAYSVLDTTRIEQALDFRPAGLEESLQACLEEIRND